MDGLITPKKQCENENKFFKDHNKKKTTTTKKAKLIQFCHNNYNVMRSFQDLMKSYYCK